MDESNEAIVGTGIHSGDDQQVEWFGQQVFLRQDYYVCFPDERKEMTKDQWRRYLAAKQLPGPHGAQALMFLDPKDNPNIRILKGFELIELGAMGYTPLFDNFFDMKEQGPRIIAEKGALGKLRVGDIPSSRRLVLVPPDGMDFFWQRALARQKANIKRRL